MKRENFTIIFLIIIDATLCTRDVNVNRHFCTATECIHASASILGRINADINPCDNFYEFACGGFIDDTLVPDERVSVDVYGQLKDIIDQQLNSVVRNHPASGLYKQMQGLYDECMNRRDNVHQRSTEHEAESLEELREILNSLGGWPVVDGSKWNGTDWSFYDSVKGLRNTIGFRDEKLFETTTSQIILRHASAPSLYPSESYKKYRRFFKKYLMNVVEIFKASYDTNDAEIEELLDFEYKLNELNYRLSQASILLDTQNSSKDLPQNFLNFQWLDLFHPSLLQYIQVNQSDASIDELLDELKNLLDNTSHRTQANFLIWRLVDYAGSHVIGSVRFAKFQLERAISGRQDMEQAWKECVGVIEKELPYMVGWHFTKDDDLKLKNSAIDVLSDIKYEFTQLINNSTWFDEATRVELHKKLQHLTAFIAYPTTSGFSESQISEFYGEIDIDKNQYVRTLLQLRIIDADNKFREIYTSVEDVDDWKKYLPPISMSAIYSEFENSLRLSYSIIMNIINHEESLRYLNYGTIGFTIGHEISHIVNQFLNQAYTWPEKFRNEFTAKKQCVMEQYDSYREPETLKNVDGKRTLRENIADLMGIKLAYSAYKRWDSRFNSTRHSLIGVNFTENQLFWIAMAQTFCRVSREEETERQISSDIYALERFRVIGMVENSPDFYNDFECSAEMNRANECVIW